LAITAGQTRHVGELAVRATFTRHGTSAVEAEAVGFLLTLGGHWIWHTGDTEYDARLRDALPAVDLGLFCINGTGGNMNAHEAALLAWQTQAREVVPMHYGLWSAAGYASTGGVPTLDPALFAATYRRLGGAARVTTPTPGRPLAITGS
jgi:L-ascorbate metabolism protein UlaG (beta-lactamase superfamily)